MGDNEDNSNQVDDQGTSEAEGRELLKKLRDAGFEGNDEKFALALGRPVEEVEGLMSGAAPVDDDAVMKARGIRKNVGLKSNRFLYPSPQAERGKGRGWAR